MERPDDLSRALVDHLKVFLPSTQVQSLRDQILPRLLQCIGSISEELRSSQHISIIGTTNHFGDEQLNVDIKAERILRDAIRQCQAVKTVSSEEDPIEKSNHDDQINKPSSNSAEMYTIAFDPLDGSSIIEPNWSVGTIIGIWAGKSALRQDPRTGLVAAVLGLYGARTSAIIALRAPNSRSICFEVGRKFEGQRVASWDIVRPRMTFTKPPFKNRYFAPGNLRAASDSPNYMALVQHYIQERYTLRYSGGLVPDIVHALVKSHGIYVSHVTFNSKAKLRRLYELAPVALVIECAGGKAIDTPIGPAVLDEPIEDCDERAGIICGTPAEVDFVVSFSKDTT